MSFDKSFFKYGLQYNHWVSHLVMKIVYYVVFQKVKLIREGNNDKNDNFEMDISDEGTLDKVLEVTETNLYIGKPWNKIYEIIDDGYFKQTDVYFPVYFLVKFKTGYNISHFIPVDVKKINKLLLNMACFLILLKLNVLPL